jgi:hypothetical protein
MAFIPIPRGIEVVIHAKEYGQDRITVLHAQAAAAPTTDDVDNAAAAVASWIEETATKANFSGGVTFVSVQGKDISVANGYQTTVPLGSVTGTYNNGIPLPGNVSLVVSLHTNHGGRRGRGRVFMYGLRGDMLSTVEQDMITPSQANAYFEIFSTLRDEMAAANVPLSVASRLDAAVYPVIAVTVDPSTDSMRRRLHGRGS